MTGYRLVLIEWCDSIGVSSDWIPIGEPRDCAPLVIQSVGWLVLDGEQIKTIVPHLHPTDEDKGAVESGCGDMTIPVCSIKSITDLVRQ